MANSRIRSQEREGRRGRKVGLKVGEFRMFIVYKIRCPRSSPIGSGRMVLNGQPGLKEQIRVNGMIQMKINARTILLFLVHPQLSQLFISLLIQKIHGGK